ncbi:DUF167 domain-containing protein [Methanolobus halotolerans]|uniref:UPF0235 protein CUN85_02795 n=1 Tax=Methanolobus halotolerans TaxID=2052935 RepID=A0A4E0PZK7_9EURY|nr:DUF167 domain-containing protein [Methanolobus halotolerans]TGC11092.1 YggU family protein [Methanolobus halotolerans]
MPFEDALKKTEDGIIIDIDVTPGSKKTCIPSGYNPWRKRIEVRLSENAFKGKANEQLIEVFAFFFGLTASEVCIINGRKSTKKSVLLKGLDHAKVVSIIKDELDLPEC